MDKQLKDKYEDLRKSIIEILQEKDFADSDGILVDYIVVGHQLSYSETGDAQNSYFYLLSNDSLPYHNILGLLKMCEYALMGNDNE